MLFIPTLSKDVAFLGNFPGFMPSHTNSPYKQCKASPSIVYSLVNRILSKSKDVVIDPRLKEWLEQPFTLRSIPESFHYHTKPLDFQVIALRYMYTLESAGILLDPGMGKSKVVLDYIYLQRFKKSLIVCPSPLLFVWEDEILKHRPELKFYVVQSTDWEKEKVYIEAYDVIIINYNKAVIFENQLAFSKFDYIHLDEFLIKDPKTARTKSLNQLAKSIPFRSGGSGTLVNNSHGDMFCPVRFLQPELVGQSYTKFVDRYGVVVKFKTPQGGERKMVFGFKDAPEIRSILDSCCVVLTKEEWLKLPKKHTHDIWVDMGSDQAEAFRDLAANYHLNLQGRDLTIENPLVMLSKLYQISQGFVYFYTQPEVEVDLIEEDLFAAPKTKLSKANRDVVFFTEQPKIKALRGLLEGELRDRKCMIWFNLESEHDLIHKMLTEMGESFSVIKGGDKKLGDKVREFNRNPSIKRLVCQAKSVNYGITVLGTKKRDLEDCLQEAFPSLESEVYTQVFYSVNFSLEVALQQVDRIHRLGQTNDCHYYRIFVKNPLEMKLKKSLEDKLSIRREMLVDIAHAMNSTV